MSLVGNATGGRTLYGKIHTINVDDTLSVSGACAEARVTGEFLRTLDTRLTEHKDDSDRHITAEERSSWNNKAPVLHAARHATGGKDPITPAQIGAAPAGYGYGEKLKSIDESSEADFEASLDAELATLADKQAKQIAFSCYDGLKSGATYFGTLTRNTGGYSVLYGCSADNTMVFKSKSNGAWTPFEWDNPPMVLDEEYRTTERYRGKSVYTVLLSVDELPNNELKKFETDISATQIVSCNASYEDNDDYGFSYTDSDQIPLWRAEAYSTITITVKTNGDYTNTTGYFFIKYTKD